MKLPNDCGLIAAAACKFLESHGVKARVLSLDCGPVHNGHSLVVFECGNHLRVYDCLGTSNFTHGVKWEDDPNTLATYWLERYEPEKKLISAIWI